MHGTVTLTFIKETLKRCVCWNGNIFVWLSKLPYSSPLANTDAFFILSVCRFVVIRSSKEYLKVSINFHDI